MFSSKKDEEKAGYPTVPGSLRDDSFEMSDMRKVQEARADTSPYITPYLSLRSRLSQLWFNRWTILLLLVLVRVLILLAQLDDDIGQAKTQALSSCSTVEDVGSAVASMPHYLSDGVNELAAYGIDKAVAGMLDVLNLMLDGVEGLILFFINFMTATYVCLITALVHGSLDMVASATREATDVLNDLVSKVTGEIDDISGDLSDGINKLVEAIKNSVFGGLVPDVPKVDFSQPIDDLKDFKFNADDFEKDVREFAKDIPTFSEVQKLTQEAVSTPFNFIKQALNDTYGDYSFDKSVFPLAQTQQLTFCSDNDILTDFFQSLYDLANKARIIFLVVIIVLAVLAIAPMAWLEVHRWRRQQKYAKLIARNQYDSMDVIYIASRPMTASWGIKIASKFRGKRQIMVRWFIAYATSTPAIFVLSLAVAGFFSCLCQFILLKAIQKEVPALTAEVGGFADKVVSSLEQASEAWANDANKVIVDTNSTINDDLLGHVRNATDAVNNTLNVFLDEMNSGLKDAFGGTILLDPMKTVINCVIGIKIESVQNGLTWVHDHAQVSLPTFPNDTFSLGAKDSIDGNSKLGDFLASPSSVTTDEVTGAVTHVTNYMYNNLIQEALISTGLLGVYVIVVLLGMVRMLAGMAMRDRGRGEGGGGLYTGDNRAEQTGWEPEQSGSLNQTTMSGAQPDFGDSYRGLNSDRKF